MNESYSIRLASTEDIPLIASLAIEIWPITYKDILSSDQIRYMMDMIYAPASLKKQMVKEEHQFIILLEDIQPVGFASYAALEGTKIFKLHKVYVLANQQGKGLGKLIIDWIIHQIRAMGANALRLNVNRFNKAKEIYERLGFSIIGKEDIDIGNGYFMNDYIMEKKF